MKMNRDSDVTELKVTSNDGVLPWDNEQLKPGAKDSIPAVSNETVSFAPSASAKNAVKGPLGGAASK